MKIYMPCEGYSISFSFDEAKRKICLIFNYVRDFSLHIHSSLIIKVSLKFIALSNNRQHANDQRLMKHLRSSLSKFSQNRSPFENSWEKLRVFYFTLQIQSSPATIRRVKNVSQILQFPLSVSERTVIWYLQLVFSLDMKCVGENHCYFFFQV